MAYRKRVASVVILAIVCGGLDGCATLKKLVPWGKSNSDANTTAPVEQRDDSQASSASQRSKTISVDDRETLSRSEPSSDQSAKPVDLSIPRIERNQAAINDPRDSAPIRKAELTTDAAATSVAPSENPTSNGADDWGRAVQQAIHSRWVQPRGPNIPTDFSCDVMVQLTPFGGVNDVKVVRSCGDPALDASIETAVRESSPLPAPKDPADFSETLMLTFTPR